MPEGTPADYISEPLTSVYEKLVWPMHLNDVKIVIEGVTPSGEILQLRSAATVEVDRPENLTLVEITPFPLLPPSSNTLPPANENHVALVGKFLPDDEGTLYVVRQLQEREL